MGQWRVAVAGGTGRTGKEVVRYLNAEEGIEVVGVVARSLAGKSMSVVIPGLKRHIPIYGDLADLLKNDPPHVLVDFTTPHAAKRHFYMCLERGIHPVIGTTGFTDEDIAEFAQACAASKIGAAVIPNFSIGGLALRLAAQVVAGMLDDVAVLESYPHSKKDAPSGTSQRLAALLSPSGPKGPKQVPIHSVRLDGVMPQQEVRFGGQGEMIAISHVVSDRLCFGRGVALVIKKIANYPMLIQELDLFI